MSNVYELLHLNAGILENFALQGRDIEKNVGLDRILRDSTRKLKAIQERMQDDGKRPAFNVQSIEEVISKVKRCVSGAEQSWSAKELRIVTYYMFRFCDNQITFDYVIQLLETNWRDLFINGLLFFLMNYWNICGDNILTCVCEIIKKHIYSYTGAIKRYQILKEHSDLLEKAGPIRLATLLYVKKIPPEDAPCVIGYKRSSLSFPFFSDVIINYYMRLPAIDYQELEELLKKHPLDRTKKLLYARLVEDAEEKADGNLQDMIVRSARRMLGDINVSTTWSPFTGAKIEDILLLNKAKDLVIAWGARKTVDAFFDICVQDSRRRNFWLRYVDNIMDYRIVGSTYMRTKLQACSEVAPLLKSSFIETNSKVSTTAALVLFIKDKVFVEFSDVGSLYIYNISNRIVRDIKKKRYLDSTTTLKNPSIGKAIDQITQWSFYCFEEGKISHLGEWEVRFGRWMREKMELSPGHKTRYYPPRASQSNQQPFNVDKKNDDTPKQSSANEATNPNIIQPGTRIKTNIQGTQSKWIFDDSCRLLADKNGIYVHLSSNNRIYYVAPSQIKNLERSKIWLIRGTNNNMYSIRLLLNDNGISQETIGTIERVGTDIIYHPANRKKVIIHTQ